MLGSVVGEESCSLWFEKEPLLFRLSVRGSIES